MKLLSKEIWDFLRMINSLYNVSSSYHTNVIKTLFSNLACVLTVAKIYLVLKYFFHLWILVLVCRMHSSQFWCDSGIEINMLSMSKSFSLIWHMYVFGIIFTKNFPLHWVVRKRNVMQIKMRWNLPPIILHLIFWTSRAKCSLP